MLHATIWTHDAILDIAQNVYRVTVLKISLRREINIYLVDNSDILSLLFINLKAIQAFFQANSFGIQLPRALSKCFRG